ncbi:ATP-binding protein [Vibrio sp. S4M6]|uniref:ATP-binding protein n=1 Tax=Vibrio sinus TaxID=2946865 RepID=UPI00202AA478|nr:ATP-binding protein [Vibrio sinus]MCL9781935.1 ATP-binding protein [Vibrio sinus]
MRAKQSFIQQLSLKNRLLLAALLWLSTMICAAGFGMPLLVKNYLTQDLKSQLSLYMDQIVANIEVKNGKIALTTRLSDPRFTRPYSGLYWSITTGKQTLRSRSLWDKRLEIKKTPLKTIIKGAQGEELVYLSQVVYLPDFPNPVTVIIGSTVRPLEKTIQQLKGQLWLILAALYIGVLVLIRLQVGWSLKPLNKMKRELGLLKSGEQSSLDESYPKEVSPLVADLNALIFHYQELLERARNHAGNLSHALKTPLSVLKNEVTQLEEPEREKLTQPVKQIQNHIDYHLGRARMAGSMNILSVKAPISERIDAISLAFDKVYASRNIVLINELDSELKVSVDPTDLDEMVGNLLENGYKWAKSVIRVYSETLESNLVQIIIEDDGPGIKDDNYQDVVKRGVRLDETTPGSGLGLNIVSEMAHSYRGALELERGKMGGLKATLTLKLASTT